METDQLELDSYISPQLEFDGRNEDYPMSTICRTLELESEEKLKLEEDSAIELEYRDWP